MKLNRIKMVLVEHDLSQTWLSEQLGKSFSTVNAYCSNRQQPSLKMLQKIAEILNVDIKELINSKCTNQKHLL
jgi:putative transcriptional regulator